MIQYILLVEIGIQFCAQSGIGKAVSCPVDRQMAVVFSLIQIHIQMTQLAGNDAVGL